jgi:hypothetical protein
MQIVTKERLIQQRIELRTQRVQEMPASAQRDRVLESLSTGVIPRSQFPENFDITRYVRRGNQQGAVAEFIGSDNFAQQFYERQRYEVEAGRDEEPILYPALYAVTTDPNLPRSVLINTLGPAGVIFEEITEGGEVKFATVGEGEKSVTMRHYAVGLQYTEDIFIYNELFRLSNIERQFGIAHNALLNHIHMAPVLSQSYTGNNATDGTALTTFKATADMPEKYMRTFEAAITASVMDKKNPRRGPYLLLCSSADLWTLERALGRVPQQGFDAQSSARNRIRTIVAYDGWTGTRGKKSVSYDGVAAGETYLIDLANRTMDFQSFFKQPLRVQQGDGDASRFIMAETIFDSRFGVFADPLRSVHKITLPVAASGAS